MRILLSRPCWKFPCEYLPLLKLTCTPSKVPSEKNSLWSVCQLLCKLLLLVSCLGTFRAPLSCLSMLWLHALPVCSPFSFSGSSSPVSPGPPLENLADILEPFLSPWRQLHYLQVSLIWLHSNPLITSKLITPFLQHCFSTLLHAALMVPVTTHDLLFQ